MSCRTAYLSSEQLASSSSSNAGEWCDRGDKLTLRDIPDRIDNNPLRAINPQNPLDLKMVGKPIDSMVEFPVSVDMDPNTGTS